MSRKDVHMKDLPDDVKKKCNGIIHTASVAAGGVGTGLAQIPLADNAVITPIQITMIISLGKVFDQTISKSVANSILHSAAASFIGRGVSQVLVGWIPGVGNVINTATAAGITEAIGWMVASNFFHDKYAESRDDKSAQEAAAQSNIGQEEMPVNEEDNEIQRCLKKAEEFLNGEKSRKENTEEYKKAV